MHKIASYIIFKIAFEDVLVFLILNSGSVELKRKFMSFQKISNKFKNKNNGNSFFSYRIKYKHILVRE